MADWVGFRSPFVMPARGVLHLRNTLLLDSYISVEVVYVSFKGSVHMHNVTFANVTLMITEGAVVSTTGNDYQRVRSNKAHMSHWQIRTLCVSNHAEYRRCMIRNLYLEVLS